MKNEKLYRKTVDILLDAYNAGELKHDSCMACAVGNLVKAGSGFLGDDVYFPVPMWDRVFYTGYRQNYYPEEYTGRAKIEIDSTGYSLNDLMKIEQNFESASALDYTKETQYYGLCAVLDVLAKIHEANSEENEVEHTKLETIYGRLSAQCV